MIGQKTEDAGVKAQKKYDIKQTAAILLLMVPISLLWNTPVVYPLKILVVFFHELSHGLASVATGGRMLQINLSGNEGGMCTTLGGNNFLILTAGYLGSMLWGGLILVAAARTRYDKQIASALGIIVIGIGILKVRPFISFGFLFCIVMGAILFASGRFLGERINDFLLKFIGVTSCLYAVMDIVSDGIARNIPDSDANALGRITFIPGIVWSVIWLAAAVAVTFFFLKIASKGAVSGSAKKD